MLGSLLHVADVSTKLGYSPAWSPSFSVAWGKDVMLHFVLRGKAVRWIFEQSEVLAIHKRLHTEQSTANHAQLGYIVQLLTWFADLANDLPKPCIRRPVQRSAGTVSNLSLSSAYSASRRHLKHGQCEV